MSFLSLCTISMSRIRHGRSNSVYKNMAVGGIRIAASFLITKEHHSLQQEQDPARLLFRKQLGMFLSVTLPKIG